jgi:outer membrane protein insertion porin family
VLLAGFLKPLHAQVPLSAVDDETSVSRISFNFVEDVPFTESALEDQIWHTAPGFWDRFTRLLPVLEASEFPFDPLELQRDTRRLERYFRRNGFLHPTIDYPASQVDTVSNRIHLIFTVRRGPPLIIQDIGFYSDENTYVAEAITEDLRRPWIAFRDDLTLETGGRYTDFEGIRIQDAVLTWLQNVGFAFAQVDRDAQIDSTANTVDLRFNVDPGPRGTVSEVQIEGNESVRRNVVLRELPLRVGDRFSAERLSQGQRELFELNLFRVVIADLPEQPRDSTVLIRYRLTEARPRRVTALTGYALEQGALVQGSWTHRNFLGDARQLTASATYSSGYGAARAGGFGALQQKGGSVTITQPYLFTRKLAGVFSPSYMRGEEPRLGIRFEEGEINTSLVYTIYNFRTITFNHTLSRARPLGDATGFASIGMGVPAQDPLQSFDIFNRNVFSLGANLGNVDDYLQPSSGFMIRPRLEMGGILVPLPDDVDYLKAQTEIVGYLPVGESYNLSGRLFAGNIWPRAESRNQTDPQVEFRFDRIRFYAGGANDVRGWPANLLGPTVPVTERSDTFDPVLRDSIDVVGVEPWGGLAKLAANVELRTPAPFLGSSWKGALFLDAGQVFPRDAEQRAFRIRDVRLRDLRLGTGVGLRYQTVVGFLRVDLGYKINPTVEDLASPEEVYLLSRGYISTDDVETSFIDRFRFHLSIGQTF